MSTVNDNFVTVMRNISELFIINWDTIRFCECVQFSKIIIKSENYFGTYIGRYI